MINAEDFAVYGNLLLCIQALSKRGTEFTAQNVCQSTDNTKHNPLGKHTSVEQA